MGRSTALSAARSGYGVVISGRRRTALEETADAIAAAGGRSLTIPLDAGDEASVADAHRRIETEWGAVTDLVYAAGVNSPRRYWRDQSVVDFNGIVQTNLVSAVRLVDAVLPGMRGRHGGTIVIVSSYSGWRFQPGAGVAYSASKAAVSSLCETLNAQEGANGIRTCNLCPGDVDTDFLAMRPTVPDAAARAAMLTADDVASAVQFVLDSPAHMRIDELVIAPTGMPR